MNAPLLRPARPMPRSLSTAARDTKFFVAEQLLDAPDDAVRAGILLRVPDAVIAAKAKHLKAACKEACFELGSNYVDVRLAHQSANRDRLGNLPAAAGQELDRWRSYMVVVSEGGR